MSYAPQRPPSIARSYSSVFREEFDSRHSLPRFGRRLGDTVEMETPRSPTPREVRRLASEHNFVLGASAKPPRLGLWRFVATHLSLPAAFCAGIICLVVSTAYTGITSKQMLECPEWANDCQMADKWTVENLGTIQGIITLIYLIGMAALGYVALLFCEAAIWPLAHKQWFTIGGLNAYLATSRGSIISAPAAIRSVRSVAAGGVLVAALAVILLPVAGPPLVGHAFTPAWQNVELSSNYTPGGGINEMYAQTNPPTSVVIDVLANYVSWARNPSSEPLPDHRDWYIDRQTLSQRGNLSARAVKLNTTVSCIPHQVEQFTKDDLFWNGFKTNMSRISSDPSNKGSSSEVWFRPQPQLTLWADSFEFVSNTTTRTTLIFAAINGTIEGGASTPLRMYNLTSASAVSCTVQVSAQDSILDLSGSPDSAAAAEAASSTLPTLSSLSSLTTPNSTLNELLLWFAVSPLLTGPSVDGAQPSFFNSSQSHLPMPFTTSSSTSSSSSSSSNVLTLSESQNNYTIPGLERFIHLSIGALAQSTTFSSSSSSSSESSSTAAAESPGTSTVTIITTLYRTKKLVPSRAYLLLIPFLLTLAILTSLAVWNARAHKKLGIPVVRLVSTGEVLKSAQTAYLRELAATDAAKAYLPNELSKVPVRYGVCLGGRDGRSGGIVGFGSPADVVGFVDDKDKKQEV